MGTVEVALFRTEHGFAGLIKERFRWGDWDQDNFTQCGVQIESTPEGFLLSQPRYLDSLAEIPLCSARKKQKSSPTTDREKSQLRALLGGLSWYSQQTSLHVAAEVSLRLSEVCESTVETIVQTNQFRFLEAVLEFRGFRVALTLLNCSNAGGRIMGSCKEPGTLTHFLHFPSEASKRLPLGSPGFQTGGDLAPNMRAPGFKE